MKKLSKLALATLMASTIVPYANAETWPGYLECNGTDRYMLIPNSDDFAIPKGGARTISMKVKVNVTGNYSFLCNRVRSYANSNNNEVTGLCFYTYNATTVSANFPATSWTAFHTNRAGTAIQPSDGWVYLCWVYTSTDAKLYIIPETATDVTASTITGSSYMYTASHSDLEMPSYSDIMVGAQITMTNNQTFSLDNRTMYTNGNIDDIRMYNYSLTADEVIEDLNSDTYLADKEIIAAYNFDTVDGTTIEDISGNGHNATLYNFPSYSTTVEPEPDVTEAVNTPIFITLGQSNADGSAMFDTDEDSRLSEWYNADHGNLKMYYRSTYVVNQSSNSLGEAARWVFDGTTKDVDDGWLDLWYRNENTSGRTAMNMIHGYGTWSTGTDTSCAQGRRGMEGQFGVTFHEALPEKDLYMIKLGVSGSFISSWAYPNLDHNWQYFMTNIYKPAIESMLKEGKRPVLTGIWWMQGCADSGKTQDYYDTNLSALVDNCRSQLGYDDAYMYIGHIVKPNESTVTPSGSVSYSDNVRNAQDAVAARYDRVVTVDTKDCPMQYESAFSGYIHFSHKGVNKIGQMLATSVAERGESDWTLFSTPGTWSESNNDATFTPSIGNPTITYERDGDVITATLSYPGWSETKTYTVTSTGSTDTVVRYDHYDGTVNASAGRTERYIGSMTVSDGTNSVTVSGPGSGSTRQIFKDQTDVVLNTTAGKTLTFNITDGAGSWSHTYVYIDYNNDGVFTPELGDNCKVTENSELVAFNAYSTDLKNWYNSEGVSGTNNYGIVSPSLPTITLPANLANGTYRVRYKVDWNCIDAYGSTETDNDIAYNSGTIIDFMLSVSGSTSVDDLQVSDNATVEYFNLNGVRVNGNNLTPGLYIARKGAQVTKVIVK